MRKWVLIPMLFFCSVGLADVNSPTEWTEVDGSPSVYDPWKVSVSNGTLTDNGDGSVTVTTSGGTPGSGSPTGPNNSYQYNNGGAFAGDAAFTFDTTTTTATATSLLANIFTVGTSTGVRATATGGVITLTEQNGSGTKNELTFDLENNSRITASSNTRNTLIWKGSNTGSKNTLFTNYSTEGSSLFDTVSDAPTGTAQFDLFPEGSNDWAILSGGSSHATRADHLGIYSYTLGRDALQINRSTGQAHFRGGDVTTSVIKTGTGGSGIDYKYFEVDGETTDMTSTWLEDQAIAQHESSLASGNMGVIFGPASAELLAGLEPLTGSDIGSGFGISGSILGIGFIESQSTFVGGALLTLGTNDGTAAGTGETLGRYSFFGNDGTDLPSGAEIAAVVADNWTASSSPANLNLSTTPIGANDAPVQRIGISSEGSIVINETGVSTADVRMESDNDTDMFLLDSSADSLLFGSGTSTISKTGTIMASAFQVSTATGIRGTGTAATLTLTEQQSAGTKSELTFDIANNSIITARSNNRDVFLWRGSGGGTTLTSFASTNSSYVDSSSNLNSGSVNFRLSPEGTNDWQFEAGGSTHAGANYLALNSSALGAHVVEVNKTTGNWDFKNGAITTTTNIIGSGTVGNTQAFMGKSTNIGCIMMRDTDDAGWTELTSLNGVLTATVDADGVCDGA